MSESRDQLPSKQSVWPGWTIRYLLGFFKSSLLYFLAKFSSPSLTSKNVFFWPCCRSTVRQYCMYPLLEFFLKVWRWCCNNLLSLLLTKAFPIHKELLTGHTLSNMGYFNLLLIFNGRGRVGSEIFRRHYFLSEEKLILRLRFWLFSRQMLFGRMGIIKRLISQKIKITFSISLQSIRGCDFSLTA